MDYPKSVPNVGLVDGKFVDENITTGQVGSLIPSPWGNAVTDEMLNVIRAGGDQPVENKNDQLLAAIKAIVRDSIPPEKIRTTLAEYGITDAYTKSVTYTKAEIEALLKNMSALPVGAMVPFPKGTVPPGFLEVDGSVQSTATYPDLAAYLGTTFNTGGEGAGNFRLPDSRGEFLRGWDHGRGIDAGRSIGASQLDQFQGFRMAPLAPSTGFSTYGAGAGSVAGGSGLVASLTTGGPVTDGINGAPRFGSETRPRNLAVMWCIKAWNAPINQGNIDVAALAASVNALNPENRRKTSPWAPMSLGGSYTFAHGFGVEPWVSSLEVKCVVATTGFVVGATLVVSVHGSADGGSGSTSSPIGVWHDEANAYARFGAATALLLTRPVDGVQVVVPFANFQVRLKVEK